MWSSQTHSKTKSLVNSRLQDFFGRSDWIRTSDCSPQSHSRADLAKPSRVASVHSAPPAPCFVGKNFEKTPHRGVFPSFSLDPEPLILDNQKAAGANPIVSEDIKQDASCRTRPVLYGRSDQSLCIARTRTNTAATGCAIVVSVATASDTPLRCPFAPPAVSATGGAVGAHPGPSRWLGTIKEATGSTVMLQSKNKRTPKRPFCFWSE